MSAAQLARLIEATPLPPETADPDHVLAAFADMYAAREALLAELGPIPVDDESRALVVQLTERVRAWNEVLARHRSIVGGHRNNVGKLRGYSRPL